MSVWDWIAGQEHAAQILQASSDAPGDSYLFTGPPGVGKAEAARAFAASLICPNRCGICSICTRIRRGIHPDVQIFQPEGLTYPVEMIREMAASAARTPLEASRRVMIVEEADRIVERSQNALLKALEEPARSVHWVLVADSVEPFLPTIMSRCRVIEFAAVTEEAIAGLLHSRVSIDPAKERTVLAAARGDVERAVALATDPRAEEVRSLAFRVALESRPSAKWAFEAAEEVRGAVALARSAAEELQEGEIAALEETLAGGAWRKRVTDRHKRVLRKIETDVFAGFLIWLGSAFRDLAAASAGAAPRDLTSPDLTDAIAAAASLRPTRVWLDMCELCLDSQLAIVENANPGLVVEAVLIRLVTLGTSAGVAQW